MHLYKSSNGSMNDGERGRTRSARYPPAASPPREEGAGDGIRKGKENGVVVPSTLVPRVGGRGAAPSGSSKGSVRLWDSGDFGGGID